MYKFLLTGMVCALGQQLLAQAKQEDSTLKYVRLNEVVISANRFTESKKNVPQKRDALLIEW